MHEQPQHSLPVTPATTSRAWWILIPLAIAAIAAFAVVATNATESSSPRNAAGATARLVFLQTEDDCRYRVAIASGEDAGAAAAEMSNAATATVDHQGVEITIVDSQDTVSVGALIETRTYVVVEVDASRRAEAIDVMTQATDHPDVSFDDDLDFTGEVSGVKCNLSEIFDHDMYDDDAWFEEALEDGLIEDASINFRSDESECELRSQFTEGGFDWDDVDFDDLRLRVDDSDDSFSIVLEGGPGQLSLGCTEN